MAREHCAAGLALFALTTASVASAAATITTATGDEILIENFEHPTHAWTRIAANDLIAGDRPSAFVGTRDGVAALDGEVAIAPAPNSHGFIQMVTKGSDALGEFPDVSSCTSLQLHLMTSESYAGYRVSFGDVRLPENQHAYGYKADFVAPVGEFEKVTIPFTDFSANWDEATGDTMVRCEDNEEYCPDAATLQNMRTMAIWGEGVSGNVHLSVKSISAVGCSGEDAPAVLNHGSENDMSLSANEIPIEILDDPLLTSSVRESTDKMLNGESADKVLSAEKLSVAESIMLAPTSKISIENLDNPSSTPSESTEKATIAEDIVLEPASKLPIESLDNPLASFVSEATNKMTNEEDVSVSKNTVHVPASEIPIEGLDNLSLVSSVTESTVTISSAENVLSAPTTEISIGSLDNSPLAPSIESAEKVLIAEMENNLPAPELKISVESQENSMKNDGLEDVETVSATEMSIASSPALAGMGNVATSDEGSSMYSMARDNSSHTLTAIGGFVGFAAFLSLAVLNRGRSRGNAYVVVVGMASADEAV